jgi:deoxyribonuclease V
VSESGGHLPNRLLHRWDLCPAEAREIQRTLAEKVDSHSPFDWSTARFAVAVDVSMNRFADWLAAAAIVCDLSTGVVIEKATVIRSIRFPYVPGLLSFRELPAVIEAVEMLKTQCDVILCDGQGRAHPRGLGIACHLGLWLRKPAIGIAKSLLCGTCDEPGAAVFSESSVMLAGQEVARAIRLRQRARPIYISVGHACRLSDATALVKRLSDGRRQIWPTRAAHHSANEARIHHFDQNPLA